MRYEGRRSTPPDFVLEVVNVWRVPFPHPPGFAPDEWAYYAEAPDGTLHPIRFRSAYFYKRAVIYDDFPPCSRTTSPYSEWFKFLLFETRPIARSSHVVRVFEILDGSGRRP